MIKTFKHLLERTDKRDIEINQFSIENEVFATQTNITENNLVVTTVFYKSRSK